jgi:hypothetical protein
MGNNTSTTKRSIPDSAFEHDADENLEETKKRYPPGYVERWQRDFIDRIKRPRVSDAPHT